MYNLFFLTTDRVTERAIVVFRRIDAATAAEVQAVRAGDIRRGRPVAAVADTAQTAVVAVAITRSRVPDYTCTAELAGEVHAFVGAVVGVVEG